MEPAPRQVEISGQGRTLPDRRDVRRERGPGDKRRGCPLPLKCYRVVGDREISGKNQEALGSGSRTQIPGHRSMPPSLGRNDNCHLQGDAVKGGVARIHRAYRQQGDRCSPHVLRMKRPML